METPRSYAAHLATYIASPLKIEKLVALEFDEVPPLREIAELRYKVERENKAFAKPSSINDKTDHDGEDFVVRSLVKPCRPLFTRSPAPRRYVPVGQRERIQAPEAVRAIIVRVAEEFGLTLGDIIGRRRTLPLVLARATAIQLIRDRRWESGERRNTISQIGRFFDNRDHSTISYALDQFPIYLRHYPQVREVYDRLKEAAA